MKIYQVSGKTLKLFMIGLIGLLSSCVSDSLEKIELTTEVFSSFETTTSPLANSDTVLIGQSNTISIIEELELANINQDNIKSIVPETVIVVLNEPSDSTFTSFSSLWIYMKNDTDSIKIAEFSQESERDSDELTLRRFSVNVRNHLLDPENLQIGLGYSLNTDSVNAVNISLGASFSVSGELE